MSKKEKIINRLKSKPKDFTYEEAKNVLNRFGFVEDNKGKTSGSKVVFKNKESKRVELHKPHPSNILKPYQIKIIIDVLKEERDFYE